MRGCMFRKITYYWDEQVRAAGEGRSPNAAHLDVALIAGAG